MKNRKVEIIILPADNHAAIKQEFNPEDFIGTLKVKNIEESLKDMRNEWNRI
ncbi:MAG TPA: hypothetical protein PK771_08060 [Spirochaetota bacterium]|nr:hypothetical protein [Spirochaetota bacterium]